MTTARQCAVVWWFETNQVSTTLLDVLPYQHRVIGAETMISGHKAKVVAICGENESKDAVLSMNCMMNNNNNNSTPPKKPIKKQTKKIEGTTKKINPKKEVIELQMNNKHECQTGIGDIVPMFQKSNRSEIEIHNNATSFATTHTTSSHAFPIKPQFSSTSFNSPAFSMQYPSAFPRIASTTGSEPPRNFKFSKAPFLSGSTPHSSLSPMFLNDTDNSSSLPSSVNPDTNTIYRGVLENQQPQDFLTSWYSSHCDKKVTPTTPKIPSHSLSIHDAHSPSQLIDLDMWRKGRSTVTNSSCSSTLLQQNHDSILPSMTNRTSTAPSIEHPLTHVPPESDANKQKISPHSSKFIPSINSPTSCGLKFDDNSLDGTNTNNVVEESDDGFVQDDSRDISNSSPTLDLSSQQMDRNHKENIRMICNSLGVNKENIQFLENICNVFKRYLDEEKQDEIQKSVDNIVVISPEYLQAGENKVEIFPGGGFYMPSSIWNLISLTHGPDFSNWKSFVKDVLLQVYDDKLFNYTARGKRGRPSIDPKLLKSLFRKINEPRSRQDQLPEKTLINYINHSIANRRDYQKQKRTAESNEAVKKPKKK
ncbi:hypothetical protein PV326_010907 [Microctonus aethiopoides]|uniref:BEN domain-containing protein n=1 Tax=Microctonus aethiopoides TaxID=144406 RepID=A0AA39FI46_9HYME|nr:hypothetical protein PV326_010907 [Microctonus aethiopoides]KAK0170017.1 hypothetical protein PV328_010631 [Microctonus aethiopoides]